MSERRTFKRSELADPEFFQANKQAIDAAIRRKEPIIDDIPKPKKTPWRFGIKVGEKPVEKSSPAAPLEDARASGSGVVPPTGHVALDSVIRQSQLRDPEFYREHQAEIELAARENRILRDL